MRLSPKGEKVYIWLAYTAIAVGIIIRIVVYLQNRNLMIDEANVARNIYELGFDALTQPLMYEQYAPPIWLWLVKLSAIFFNYGEMALRVPVFLSGILALLLLHALLKALHLQRSAWYALFIVAISLLFIRYSTELKQYMTDVVVSLSLILFALRYHINNTSASKFLLIWIVAGSIGIWLSMPSVFILAGVGAYYLQQSFATKSYRKIISLVLISTIWVGQFVFYYLTILKEQANSEYLQNFHFKFFLFGTPSSMEEWKHNWDVTTSLLKEAVGFTFIAAYFNLLCLITGIVAIIRSRNSSFLLLLVPLVAVLIAASLNQYSLIPRVSLFTMPLLLILVAKGLDSIMSLRNKIPTYTTIVLCVFCIYNQSSISMIWKGYETEEITDALDFIHSNNIRNGNQVYIHNGAYPSFIYYTTIHPHKDKWTDIKNANHLNWDADYHKTAKYAASPCAFIFTSIYPDDLANKLSTIQNHKKEINSLSKDGCRVHIFSN